MVFRYRLLSLLLHLADSPVNAEYLENPAEEQQKEEETVDWLALLREGEQEAEQWEEDDTLSDWSEEESERSEKVEKESEEVSGECEEEDYGWLEDMVREADSWVDTSLLGRYWEQGRAGGGGGSEHPEATVARRVEKQLEAAGELGVRSQRVTEYQVYWRLRTTYLCDYF